ncbi:MAG: hypothetical protein KKI02_10110 [Planctomycetes bacterium]|nr:hypothetical protein [Planctomycetota bacterium]
MNRKMYAAAWTPLVFVFVSVGAVVANDYDVDWYTIDGGGEMFATGGDYELSGTIGQPDANTIAMTGGDYQLAGGFWSGVEEFCFADLDGDGEVGLSDLAQLLSNYGTPSGAVYEDGDLDGDGDVDLADLAGLLAVYGTTCP